MVPRHAARIHLLMKNDYSFKLVTVIVLGGVLVAFFSPSHATPRVDAASPEVAHNVTLTAAHTE